MDLEINFGLIVVNPEQEGENLDILHFCGFSEPPTEKDAQELRKELRDDPEFGLQELWDKVDILEAPEDIVKEYKAIVFDNPNEDQLL